MRLPRLQFIYRFTRLVEKMAAKVDCCSDWIREQKAKARYLMLNYSSFFSFLDFIIFQIEPTLQGPKCIYYL